MKINLGDQRALLQAYPRARKEVLSRYIQDDICDTWEMLADAIYPGGNAAIKRAGWPLPGQIKCEWAETIGPLLDLESNVSPSFKNFLSGIKRLIS